MKNTEKLILKKAIEFISNPLPVPKTLSRPADVSRAISLFLKLSMRGVSADQSVVFELSVDHGWQPRHAKQLAILWAKVSENNGTYIGYINIVPEKLIDQFF